MSAENNILFDMPKTQSNNIKVIGVGGGGGNAINYMFEQNIKGVDFVICNTDLQALENSPVPNKIQLGAKLTSGLGAGGNPEIGKQSAEESIEEIQEMLNVHTKMIFITAGMGGGTGTGAAPIIAKAAKDMGILTVGIVTLPFVFEGKKHVRLAQSGVDKLRKNVDSLIIINNNKLREIYGNLSCTAAYSKSDEVLTIAACGIAEVITGYYKQNIDLHDAKTVLSNSGTAIMGSTKQEGPDRAKKAAIRALDSPLLNDNKITGAKNVLLLIVSGKKEVTIDEIAEISEHIQREAQEGHEVNIIMGLGTNESLGNAISVTIVATGFKIDQQNTISNTEISKMIHPLENEQEITYDFSEDEIEKSFYAGPPSDQDEEKKVHNLKGDIEDQLLKLTPKLNLKEAASDSEEISDESILEENLASKETDIPEEKSTGQLDLSLDCDFVDSETQLETEDISEKKEVPEEKTSIFKNFDAQPTINKNSTIEMSSGEDKQSFKITSKKTPQKQIASEDKDKSEEICPLSSTIVELERNKKYRRDKMKQFNYKFDAEKTLDNRQVFSQKKIKIDPIGNSISQAKIALNKKEEDIIKPNNSFLHDNPD